jgi:hypothetical protein
MYKSFISKELQIFSKKICLCTIVNILLILFIFIVSFYLIRRINRINIEGFVTSRNISLNVDSLKLPLNKIANSSNKVKEIVNPLNKINNTLGSISGSLRNIDSKLDYITNFKSIKSNDKIVSDDNGNDIDNRSRVVYRKNYPNGSGVVEEKKENEVKEEKKETSSDIMKEFM